MGINIMQLPEVLMCETRAVKSVKTDLAAF